MPQPRNKSLVQKARRKEVASRYLRGESQYAIADALKIAQSTVSKDLKALHAQWLQAALMDLNAYKARELARIDQLELIAWQAWDASKLPRKTTVLKSVPGPPPGNQPIPVESKFETQERNGDPRYLERVSWCIGQRCKILGLEAPLMVKHGGEFADRFAAQVLSDPATAALAAELIGRLDYGQSPSGGPSPPGDIRPMDVGPPPELADPEAA